MDCFSLPDRQRCASWGPTANLSFRRAALLSVGGFDETFSRPGGEDVDLGFRLSDAGLSIVCNPLAIAYHTSQTWSSFGQIWRRFLTYGQADAVLIRKHPARTVWDLPTPAHMFLMVAVLALGAAVVGERAWLLAMPFAWAALMLALYSQLALRRARERATVGALIEQVTALIFLSALDLGRLSAAAVGHWPGLYRRVLFFDEQQVADWPDVATSSLAGVVALFVVLLGMTIGLAR